MDISRIETRIPRDLPKPCRNLYRLWLLVPVEWTRLADILRVSNITLSYISTGRRSPGALLGQLIDQALGRRISAGHTVIVTKRDGRLEIVMAEQDGDVINLYGAYGFVDPDDVMRVETDQIGLEKFAQAEVDYPVVAIERHAGKRAMTEAHGSHAETDIE